MVEMSGFDTRGLTYGALTSRCLFPGSSCFYEFVFVILGQFTAYRNGGVSIR